MPLWIHTLKKLPELVQLGNWFTAADFHISLLEVDAVMCFPERASPEWQGCVGEGRQQDGRILHQHAKGGVWSVLLLKDVGSF